ncbi:MAG: EcsC family protein [Chromatiales bacterium]
MSSQDKTPQALAELLPADLQRLRAACEKLEHPGLAARLTALVGTPLDRAMEKLPDSLAESIQTAARSSIEKVLRLALSSAPLGTPTGTSDRLHKAVAMGTGAVGGLFGLPGVVVELPVTTGVMMRSIADIATQFGEDPDSAETRLACVEVFALGGPGSTDDAAESGYYGMRVALALDVTAVTRQSASAMLGLVRAVAARFGVVVTDKVALQFVPLVGALGGAALNAVFMQHFQDMARGHFEVRRLERKYGPEVVRKAYETIAASIR